MIDALGVDFGPQLLVCVGFSVVCTPLTMYLATEVTEHTHNDEVAASMIAPAEVQPEEAK